jgi:hypothetical protein
MILRALTLVLLLCSLIGCDAKDVGESAGSTPQDKQSVRSGPSVLIKHGSINVGGHPVEIGGDIGDWSKALGTAPSRTSEHSIVSVWDDYGIQVFTSRERPSKVKQITVYVNLEPHDPMEDLFTTMPDGTPIKRGPDLQPKQPYRGRLELDGFQIGAATKFSEIRRHALPSRNLRCGLRDCSHPIGAFDDSAGIYLRLNGSRDDALVYEFSVGE